jgi:hypothetical protein
MIFSDILKKKDKVLKPEFDKLFDDILSNQTHNGDLLLIRTNGSYNPEVHEWTNIKEKLSPYVIGPKEEGLSDQLHYKFIHDYRVQGLVEPTYYEYLKEHEWSSERSDEIDQLTEIEGMTIQLEMLVYLKIWEADLFIKKLYQLTKLALGENYDWHFSIAESNRDKDATGTREKIIRKKIRDRLEKIYPQIYSAIKNAYRTQIRNSIAHSKYYFIGRTIHPNNYIEKDPASQLKVVHFDDWIEIFHDTMIIYNEMIRLFSKVDKHYEKEAKNNKLLQEVRINRLDPDVKTEYQILKYRPTWKDWRWNSNDE